MANNKISENTNVHENGTKEVVNWIDQIASNNTIYDIATHHSITFYEGGTDKVGKEWKGLTDLEVVIPTIADLVQNPVVFAGTVAPKSVTDTKGEISWTGGYGEKPQDGYLLFITDACTFEGLTCEGGDMAVYANGKWNIVTGEQQVKIAGDPTADKTFTIGAGNATQVLDVEGKKLSLKITDLDVAKDGSNKHDLDLNPVSLTPKYIKLEVSNNTSIGTEDSFNVATALSDGTVTFTLDGKTTTSSVSGLVTGVSFGSFTQGSFPQTVMSAKEFKVEGAGLTKTTGTDFVTSVAITEDSFFVTADSNDKNKITAVEGITNISGSNEFVKGITTTSDSGDFTIVGGVKFADGTTTSAAFIKSIDATSLVTSVTVDSFSLANGGNTIVTGLSQTETTTKGDDTVVSEVSINTTPTSVIGSTSVSGNVLIFNPATVVSTVTPSYKYKSLEKTTYNFTPVSFDTKSIETCNLTKADDVTYKFEKGFESIASATSTAMWKFNTSAVTVTSGAYSLNDMKVNVSADTFVTSMTAGQLPSWTPGAITDTIGFNASVNTALASTSKTINVLTDKDIKIGEYQIVTAPSTDKLAIKVADAEEIDITGSVDLSGFVTGVAFETPTN